MTIVSRWKIVMNSAIAFADAAISVLFFPLTTTHVGGVAVAVWIQASLPPHI